MSKEQMIRVVIERANEMLKDEKISALYQSYDIKEQAKEWLIKAALATLIIPIDQRMKKHSINHETAKDGNMHTV